MSVRIGIRPCYSLFKRVLCLSDALRPAFDCIEQVKETLASPSATSGSFSSTCPDLARRQSLKNHPFSIRCIREVCIQFTADPAFLRF